jgi:putative ATPase
VVNLQAPDELLEQIAIYSNGDARQAYNTLEAAPAASPGGELTPAAVEDAMQRKVLLYDKGGEEHYNLISALHKSVRSSDVDAALYWLTRMLEGGEDRLYIARRLIRMAIEDIGLADPRALEQASRPCRRCTSWGFPKATRRWRRRPSTWPWRRNRTRRTRR